jgi:hypothetical protein
MNAIKVELQIKCVRSIQKKIGPGENCCGIAVADDLLLQRK